MAATALDEQALPWLNRFESRQAILRAFEREGSLAIGLSPAGPLDIAEVYDGIGRSADARRVVETYVRSGVNRSHAAYLAEYLPTRGYADLVPKIAIRS
jgi:hypothetical protein